MLINLLPHRSAGLVQQRKAFSYKLLLAGVLALAVAVGLSFTIEQQLNSSTAVRAQLRQELAALDGQLKGMAQLETDISAARLRQSVLQNLQHDSQQPAAWLLALVLRLPEGLHLSAVRQDGRLVQVQGVARSSAQVFELLAQMDRQSPWLLGPGSDWRFPFAPNFVQNFPQTPACRLCQKANQRVVFHDGSAVEVSLGQGLAGLGRFIAGAAADVGRAAGLAALAAPSGAGDGVCADPAAALVWLARDPVSRIQARANSAGADPGRAASAGRKPAAVAGA
jgi:type IV pilus assembly protein PilN